MKRFFITIACLATIFAANAQTEVTLETAGTLKDKISSEDKYTITELKVNGPVNGTDMIMLRDMAGIDLDNNVTEGKLEKLDMTGATIVEGGEPFYTDYSSMTDYYTTNNEISDMMFYMCGVLKSFTMPASATAIGENAFKKCTGLYEINLSESVTEIRKGAFYGTAIKEFVFPENIMPSEEMFSNCQYLTKVTLPQNCTVIPESAFSATAIAEIDIPSTVTVIGKDAFSGCPLTSITMPESLLEIGEMAFMGCDALEEIHFNDKLQKIGYSAFSWCENLVKADLPNSVTEMGNSVFSTCDNLTEVHLPEGLTEIVDGTFDRCDNLSKVNIPQNITRVGDFAFQNNSLITEFTFPESVVEIGENAFSYTGLTEIILPANLTTLKKGAFNGCREATRIVLSDKLTSLPQNAFNGCSKVEELTINEGVTEIGIMALLGCSSMKKLTLPSSLQSIGQMAIALNDALEEIHCKAAKPATCDKSVFITDFGDVPTNCTLFVPEGSKADYEAADTWSLFTKITEENTTGISVADAEGKKISARYNMAGQRISQPEPGINIVVYDDGTAEKIIVR